MDLDTEYVSKDSNLLEQLALMEKEQLIGKIISMQRHIKQLKSLLNKHLEKETICKSTSLKTKRKFDFTRYTQRHILLKFLYLGWNYDGYVVQENTRNTVEDVLFEALLKTKLIESRETCNYHRCGRTDKGVSAFSQVISITVRSQLQRAIGGIRSNHNTCSENENDAHQPEEANEDIEQGEIDYISALNGVLPKEVRVIAWSPATSSEMSARFDCKSRSYHYYFPRGQLDTEKMNEACHYLVGEHDFRNLCKMDVHNGVLNYRRRVFVATVQSLSGEKHFSNQMCMFHIEASAFLWHQIRCIMGILLLVGQGLEKPNVIAQLLDVEANPSKPQYNMATDLPLVLYTASYDLTQVPKWFYGQSKTQLSSTIAHLKTEWAKKEIQSSIVLSMINDLEQLHTKHYGPLDLSEAEQFVKKFLIGKQARQYKPLLTRPMGQSLEAKIERLQCKKRIKLTEN